jgi:hypothetical protein
LLPRPFSVLLLAASLALPLTHGSAQAPAARRIAPGVTHQFEARTDGPLTINVATVDLSRPELVLEVEKGRGDLYGSETVPAMVRRLGASGTPPIVGINGDFWGLRSVPINIFVDEGIVWRMPWRSDSGQRRAIFAFNETERFIGLPEFEFRIASAENRDYFVKLDGLNLPDAAAVAIGYNRAHGTTTPPLPAGYTLIELALASDVVLPNTTTNATITNVSPTGTTTLGPLVMALHLKDAPDWLRTGAALEVCPTLIGISGPVTGIMGGGPRLISNGEKNVDRFSMEEGFGRPRDKHPRTAIGLKADGSTLVMVTVDGRQPRRSVGVSFSELADLMEELGCVDAMNLDGGGSTTMVIEGRIVNFPSDPLGPRSVSNALFVRRLAEPGPLAHLDIQIQEGRLAAGLPLSVSIEGRDADGTLTHLNDIQLVASVGDESYPLPPPYRLPSLPVGTHEVTLTGKVGDATTITRTVTLAIAPVFQVRSVPRQLHLPSGGSLDLQLELFDVEGIRLHGDLAPHNITLPDFLEWQHDTLTVHAKANGSGNIKLRIGETEHTIPVSVGELVAQPIEPMDTANEELRYLVIRAQSPTPGPQLDTTTRYEGSGSWKVEYRFETGGTSKVGIPIEVSLPEDALGTSFQVRGDGKAHWLRGILRDAEGFRYTIDFTTSESGVDWKDEWREIRVLFSDDSIVRSNKSVPAPPVTVQEIYIVQPDDRRKSGDRATGAIHLDALSALVSPRTTAAP